MNLSVLQVDQGSQQPEGFSRMNGVELNHIFSTLPHG
jgi:hypothetical protein